MASFAKNNNTRKTPKRSKSSLKRKGSTYRWKQNFDSFKNQEGELIIPTMMHLQTTQPRPRRVSRRQSHSKYSSLIYESSSIPRENCGEYSYGNGGTSFGKSIKKSKFDEEKELVYSPGPGRYEARCEQKSTMYSFGKQKKDISFVKVSSRDVPSPGKYKIKGDFLSKSGKITRDR